MIAQKILKNLLFKTKAIKFSENRCMYRPELYFELSSPSLAAISLSFGLSAGLVMLTWEASISKEYKFNI